MSRRARERALTFLLWVGVASIIVMAHALAIVVGLFVWVALR